LPRLLELIHELALFERAPEEVTVTLQNLKMPVLAPNPFGRHLLLRLMDMILALLCTMYATLPGKAAALYLEDLIVTEEYRGKGIGKFLFDHLFQETRELGFSGMVWQVLDWNEPAINFYRKYEANIEAGWLNASLSKEQILNL
jgi:GNAT superfamily N-acetyltransferase